MLLENASILVRQVAFYSQNLFELALMYLLSQEMETLLDLLQIFLVVDQGIRIKAYLQSP